MPQIIIENIRTFVPFPTLALFKNIQDACEQGDAHKFWAHFENLEHFYHTNRAAEIKSTANQSLDKDSKTP